MLTQTDARSDGLMSVEQTRYGDDVLVVSLSGELDLAVVETAREMLEPALGDACEVVVIDLGDLEFIDSSGIAMLYTLSLIRPRDGGLRLLPSRFDGVNRMLALTEVGEVMTIVGG